MTLDVENHGGVKQQDLKRCDEDAATHLAISNALAGSNCGVERANRHTETMAAECPE